MKDYVSKAEPLSVDSQDGVVTQLSKEKEVGEGMHTLLVVEDNADMLKFLADCWARNIMSLRRKTDRRLGILPSLDRTLKWWYQT